MNNLKVLRSKAGKTQQEMADALSIDRITYHRYETGQREPTLATLKKIAEYFSVTTDYLLDLTDDPQFEQPVTIAARPTDGMAPISQERLDEIIAEAVHQIRKAAGLSGPPPAQKKEGHP